MGTGIGHRAGRYLDRGLQRYERACAANPARRNQDDVIRVAWCAPVASSKRPISSRYREAGRNHLPNHPAGPGIKGSPGVTGNQPATALRLKYRSIRCPDNVAEKMRVMLLCGCVTFLVLRIMARNG